MDGHAVGIRAATLPWLTPTAGALVSLTQTATDISHDPALIVHCLRYSRSNNFGIDSAVLVSAAVHLEAQSAGRTDWHQKIQPQLLELSRAAYAQGAVHSEEAGYAAALAPLAYFAVAAVAPEKATLAQSERWGMTPHALLRNLVRHWSLPHPIAATLENLDLPHTQAVALGAEASFDRAVRNAVATAQSETISLNLTPHDKAQDIQEVIGTPPAMVAGIAWNADAGAIPLLAALLRSHANTLKQSRDHLAPVLMQENETLRTFLAEEAARIPELIKEAKLTALAELAAGAGHEINNPLAVISGQCQRLLSHEEDEETRATLETVIRQTRRIHDILRGLMAYARPAKPVVQATTLASIVDAAVNEMKPLADVKAIELRMEADTDCPVDVDSNQIRSAVVQLLRNGIEAAGVDGWVSIRIEETGQIVVEDSGPGPSAKSVQHLFDPFFSGRSAGRGRGLGLSVAWRLTNINGGSLAFTPSADSPSRFTLSLPVAQPGAVRLSA